MEAFAKELTEVRNFVTEDAYTEQLNQLETEYQFILLRSLDLFHKEMSRSNLLERLHSIKEKLCGTNLGCPTYPTDLPFTGVNENLKTCRHCKLDTLQLRPLSNELCCEKCGLLETLDGVAVDYNELYHCGGDYKVVKRRRSNRSHNFRYYLDKHLRHCHKHGYDLSDEMIQRTNEIFQFIEEHLPTRISMPFVAYMILKEIVPERPEGLEGPEHVILNYFWLHVPQGSVQKHEEEWKNMLAKFDAV